MNGRMKLFKERQHVADEFIERVNPYEKPKPLTMDLRSYAAFLKENNMSGKDVPEDVIKRFTDTN